MFTNSSGSYTSANVIPGPRTAELNGLNWHVHVEPLSLSMTSLPPIAVPDADDDDEELFELPPHAATSVATAARNMSHLKRFIDALRSTCWLTSDRTYFSGATVWTIARTAIRAPADPGYVVPRAVESWHGPNLSGSARRDLLDSIG